MPGTSSPKPKLTTSEAPSAANPCMHQQSQSMCKNGGFCTRMAPPYLIHVHQRPILHTEPGQLDSPETKSSAEALPNLFWVSDGARTHDTRNHNPMLYQLNYTHHVGTANLLQFLFIAKKLCITR